MIARLIRNIISNRTDKNVSSKSTSNLFVKLVVDVLAKACILSSVSGCPNVNAEFIVDSSGNDRIMFVVVNLWEHLSHVNANTPPVPGAAMLQTAHGLEQSVESRSKASWYHTCLQPEAGHQACVDPQ